ncbi:hypothetical protein ADIARSV_2478 [Arcticibacter svalbardensis MN12-7]|uniref:HTH cro/C1-type domain-containing protein n=1 Tax=Arcticibacter svalbardensis MN12-7 TaxID=1150600 RepID=R9GS18_9SPHI|nr:helix-turn-helix transcriptional regulator [Arcticibacter svalbardensis]EOR94350.1 hypothetical protein ADIARSV_2478 [Arcticibacter svalbardensis MN12-7]
MVTIGQTLQKLRESNGVSGSSIAKAAGLSTATYYNVERGYKEASFIVIFRICRFYEISLHEFADIVTPAELERPELTSIRFMEKRKAKLLRLLQEGTSSEGGTP